MVNWISLPALIPLGFLLGDTLYRCHRIFSDKEETRLWGQNALAALVVSWACQCLSWCGMPFLEWLLVTPAVLVLLFTVVLGLAKMLHVL